MTIKEFLQNPVEYPAGVSLYDAYHGKGKWSKKISQSLPEKVLMKKLIYYLEKISDKSVSIPQHIVSSAPTAPRVQHKQEQFDIPLKVIQESQKQIYGEDRSGKELQARALYTELGRKRELLYSKDPEVRRVASLQIKSLGKQNRALWDEINFYDKHGRWPDQDNHVFTIDLSSKTPLELFNIKGNLASWLSKEKKKIDAEQDQEKKKARQLLYDSKKIELEAVKSKMLEV